ncbi:hypothetical protein NXC24_PB00064 (plasmid) [Rhizobium sp. NXC24]|nr:hypothetical protein NXC24_PB00064 [Rhizobium sp. NXC24]
MRCGRRAFGGRNRPFDPGYRGIIETSITYDARLARNEAKVSWRLVRVPPASRTTTN